MPKMPLSSENKAKNSYEFPKLFLDKGERARLALLDPVPETQYVHTLRAPQLQNGKAVMEEVDGKEKMKMDFVGRHICIGDFDKIADKGLDANNCPVCAESKKSDAVKPPERRHAMNVIRYATKPGAFTVANPFQVSLLVWSFADSLFNTLVEFAEEWGDLRAHDLLLGPCEVKMFQKMDYNMAQKSEWMASDERKSLTVEVFKNNAIEDLSIAIGRKLSKSQVEDDLAKVLERYAVANGTNQASAGSVAAAEVDVNDILSDGKAADAPDFAKEPAEKAEAQAEKENAEAIADKPTKTTDQDMMDLDDILGS